MGPCLWRDEIGQCTCPSGSSISYLDELPNLVAYDKCSHAMSSHVSYHMGPQVATQNELVDELIARVKFFHIIQVNGTPASGKTTLKNLMMKSVRSANGWAAYLHKQTGISRYQWLIHREYLFLDETQQSYWDDQLRAELFKAVELVSQIYIVLFMSYGSPTLGFNCFEQEKYIKMPMVFGPEQQIALKPNENIQSSWRAVGLLSENEGNQVLDRYTQSLIPNCGAILTQDLKQGFFRSILIRVPELYDLVRRRQPITWSMASKILFSNPKGFFDTMRALPFTRGLPPANILQRQGVASVLKDAIACDGVYQSSFENKSRESQEALERIWVNGWLHAETSGNGIRFVFASQLHRWYCQHLLTEKGPDNELAYSSPLILAIEAIKRFRPYQLSDPLRSITDPAPSPYEDQCQKEFYRCLFPLLDGHAIMSPEFLIKTGIKGGTIDFYVAQKKWGLEFLRNRDRVLEHMQRFEPNGQYYHMIEQGKMEQFIVIDFTNELPKKAYPEFQGHLYHVVFSENYHKVRVMDAGLNEVVCFVLMENSSPVH
ncbi:hypothetical protein BDV32DRAFT_137656 [Aspergillus pseudonomiae]|nr:hypothetical protein BDV32DRAFT_137656 [Aspergillus pseudonomiae]